MKVTTTTAFFFTLLAFGIFIVAFFNTLVVNDSSSRGVTIENFGYTNSTSSSSIVDDYLRAFTSSNTAPRQEKQQQQEPSFSACLLIKDDNDLLEEWLAYHYYTLELRYLVVAIDPSSIQSPIPIFNKYMNLLPDLNIVTWNDTNFMPQHFLKNGYHTPPRLVISNANKSQWHDGNESPSQVKADRIRINNHRYRQVVFLSRCLRHMKHNTKPNTMTVHIDTDEYVVVSPLIMRRNRNNKGRMLFQKRNIAIPSIQQPSSIANYIRQIYNDKQYMAVHANFPCLSMPRLLYGSVEDNNDHNDNDRAMMVSGAAPFNTTTFETLRWKYHAAYDDVERNGQPKVMVAVQDVPLEDEMLANTKPFSIHRPSKKLCRRLDQMNLSATHKFPLVVNHYVGSWERYYARNDTRRRSYKRYQFKANVSSYGDNDNEGGISTGWLKYFIVYVGYGKAVQLLSSHVVIE